MPTRSRKQIRSRSCTCDLFDVRAQCVGGEFELNVVTDLPLRTGIQVSLGRPGCNYVWEILNETIAVAKIESGTRGICLSYTVDELDTLGLNKYRHWKGRWPDEIDGVPADEIEIEVYLDAADHRFGVRNRNLEGAAVVKRKDGHWVEHKSTIAVPIASWLREKLP